MKVMFSMWTFAALGLGSNQQEDENSLLQFRGQPPPGWFPPWRSPPTFPPPGVFPPPTFPPPDVFLAPPHKKAQEYKNAQACKDSDGVSIKQLDSRMVEDCTHKDFHIWHTKIKKAPTYEPGEYAKDDAWRTVKVQEEDGWQSSCVAFVQTNKTSCTDWCGVHGLKCVKAMDNAGDQKSHLRPWFEAEDYVVSQCSLAAHAEAFKGQKIEGYVDTHGCDLPLNSQICACQTTTTTTVANPPMLDDYDCTTAKNFVSGTYSQISLTDYCPNCFANPKYNNPMGKTYDPHSTAHVEALADALDYCKAECNNRNCSAFFFQKHGNGHEICAFYMEAVNLKDAVKHGHQECSQICTRKKFILGEHQARTRRPTCPENSSPVTSADTCKQSATSLDMNLDFNGIVSRPNFAPGCYHLDAPDHPLSSGIFFNDAGGDWGANTGFRGAVALVCASDNSMTYELGAPRRKPAMETAPTCPTNTASLSDESKCADYAKMAGKSFNTADLPNYPRGCSDRIDHPQFAGVWWNSAKGGTWDQQEGTWWNQHPGFTGEVALVCEPTMPHLTTCDDHLAQALTAYWEYGNCGYWGNDYNKGLCGGLLSGDCPEFWDKPENSDYIIFSEAEKKWEGISAEIKCVRAQLKSLVKSTAFTQERIFTSDREGNRKGNIGEAVSWKGAKCNSNCHYLWHAQYECVETATTTTTTYPNWDLSGDEDFVLRAKFKTQPEDKFGLIVRKALGPDQQGIVADSKILWIHDGKLTFSIGGGGHLFGPVVNDGKWHEVALKSTSGVYQLFLDNMTTPCETALYGTPLLPCKDPQNSRIYVGPSRTAVADVKFATTTHE